MMPTNQKRHTCVVCGAKRVEKYMKLKYKHRFCIPKYVCDTSKLRFEVNGNNSCSKRTPLD